MGKSNFGRQLEAITAARYNAVSKDTLNTDVSKRKIRQIEEEENIVEVCTVIFT
jgi:hypothetical protein